MAFSPVIAVVFALIGYSNGDANEMPCVERATTDAPTKICINEPAKYGLLQDKMDNLVTEGQGWDGFKSEPLDDDFEKEYIGNEDNCGTITTLEKPYILKTNSSTEISSYYVVQSKYFEQKIRVTRCKNLYSSCLKTITGSLRSSCIEKLGAVSVYVYDESVDKMVYKVFDIPVCCTCNIESEN